MLKTSIDLTRLFKQAITYVVLASLQLGTLTQVTQAYAQNVPQMAQLGAPSSAPFSGYNPDGTLYMGGQRIGNPHQVLHDAQIPAFMTITANRYTYSADPTHGQGTLAQMELATTNGSTSSVLLNRLYLSPNNPYATTQPLGQVWPYPNYQTYQGVLLNSQQAGYLGTTAQDGKDYLFKTLTAASSQAFTILIKELPNTPQFRAAADPAGGGVGVRVEQNGDTAALAAYYKTVQPYDFTWRPNAGLYTGSGNGSGSGSGQNGQLDPMYSGWANSPGGAYSGANYAEGSGAPQSFHDFIKQQQAEALANDKRVRSQTTANSLDLSNTNVNTLFGEGYNLFDYGNKANPNLAAENEYLRKLQNGEFNAGSADYNEASRIAQERYRIAYATRLETNKPLQYSVADSQRKANELNLVDTNPNKLFGDGYDLFKYDPLTNPNGAAENALLSRLQNGQLTPGSAEYDEAKSIAQLRYRNAYSNALAFNIAPKFTVAEAQRKANEIDLSQVNPNELFGQGFDLFQYNPALRPNGEAENVLLAKLQNGELTAGSPEYLEATQIAQQRLRDAYSISLVPPEPKKIPKWKMITGVVVGAILTFVTAGAAAPYVLSALTGISVAAAGTIITGGFLAGTLLGAAVTVGAGIVGGYVGAVISAGITTGSFSQALRAGEKALVSGTVKGFVTTILASSLGLGGLEGFEATLGNIAVNSLSGGITQTILNGGSFGDNLKTAAVNSVVDEIAKGAANTIGDAFPNLDGTNLANYAAHGVLGCASAAAKGADCAAGAIGAMTGEAAAATGFLDAAANSTIGRTLNKDEIVFFGGLVGGTTAAIASKAEDVNANFTTGTATASNAVANNYLNHTQWKLLADQLDKCASEADCARVRKEFAELSGQQDKALKAACDSNIDSPACRTMISEAALGTATQIKLVQVGINGIKLPESYLAGGDFNSSLRLYQAKAIASDINATCAQDPSCVQRGDNAKTVAVIMAGGALTATGLVAVGPEVLVWILSNPIAAVQAGLVTAETAAAIVTGSMAPSVLTQLMNTPKAAQILYSKLASAATQNASAMEIVLGRYAAGSAASYEQVAQARGASYYQVGAWDDMAVAYGREKMWEINKAYLNQGISKGKSFVFTSNPAEFPITSDSYKEFAYLKANGFQFVLEGGIYRGIKK